MMIKCFLAGLLACASLSAAIAGEVTVRNASASATAPGQDVGLATLTIVSLSNGQVVSVTSPASRTVEIHNMVVENGVMKMRKVDGITLSANKPVSLEDSGKHLMLIGLKKPLVAGETVPLNVTVRFPDMHEEQIAVNAKVQPLISMHHHH